MNGATSNARTALTRAQTSTLRAIAIFATLLGMLAILGNQVAANTVPSGASKPPTTDSFSGYAAFSQQGNPMDFFRAQAKDPTVRIHAAIATVPDPVATRLGRSFDLEVAALISAFEVRGYVLDGFWLTWPLNGKQADDANSRNEPSVLAFRKDVWRRCAGAQPESDCANAPAVEYYVLLLVGEAPTFGIHREAFAVAARHAAEFELWSNAYRAVSSSAGSADSTLPGSTEKAGSSVPNEKMTVLKVIGPSFSGSMQSLMTALRSAAADTKLLAFASEPCPAADAQGQAARCPRLQAQLHSPSATVLSNASAENQTAHAVSSLELVYRPVATDQCMQLHALLEYLGTQDVSLKDIAILAEESSFGLGASECVAGWTGKSDQQPRVLQFPQNIASIRAEHAQLSKTERSSESTLSLPSKFLELDMTGVDVGKDLPPPYQANLSTRSDELVLHQMLDALATFRRPAATIIIATDIRDRLFLLNEIRSALPATLPVVLEVDNLMVHPDYRQLSRGSVVVGAGDTMVCVDLQPGSEKKEISCRSRADKTPPPATTPYWPCNSKDVFERSHARQYYPFATDYAANTFRAVLRVVEPPAKTGDEAECPQLLVATLAGFQPIGDLSTIGIPADAATLGMLLSSETYADLWRFLMPVVGIASLLFLLIAVWLWKDRTGIRVLVPLPRHSIHALGAHASRCWQWLFHRAAYLAQMKAAPSPAAAPDHVHLDAVRVFAFSLGIIALVGLATAASRITGFIGQDLPPRAMALLHGRDWGAMLAIATGFGAVIVISGLRLFIWNGLCRKIADANGVPAALVERLREGGYFRGTLAAAVLLAVVAASADGASPTTVDPQPLAILLGIATLGAGTYFLVQLWFQLMRLQQLSREYARAIPIIQRVTSQADWPTPLALGQSPTNPLNLVLFREDLERLRHDDVVGWARQTVNVICGKWPFTDLPQDPAFVTWQRYLVAHVKAGASALRGCVWAALMAPIATLVMLQVYAAPFERLQTITAIGLMGLSFCTVVVATLRLEKDILLSRMFTKDADRVSFGEAIGALLPKLLVVLGVLISVFAPDLLTLLPNLSKLLGAAH